MENSNILLFLTPKSQVAYCLDTFTLRQVVEKMDYHHYTAIPVLDKSGRYVGTITEGDLLWTIRARNNLNYQESENIPLSTIEFKRNYKPVKIDCTIEDLMIAIQNQNFVPVEDDKGVFIGIVTRRSVLAELNRMLNEK